MADFCRACALELFGKDRGDLKGVTTPENWASGTAGVTICEGCGIILVDPEGNCISKDCLKAGQSGHGEIECPSK